MSEIKDGILIYHIKRISDNYDQGDLDKVYLLLYYTL
jgi:hypothetical protein